MTAKIVIRTKRHGWKYLLTFTFGVINIPYIIKSVVRLFHKIGDVISEDEPYYTKIHKFSSNCMLTRINVCHLRRLIFLFWRKRGTQFYCASHVHKRNPMRSGNGLFHWESSSADLLNISCSGPKTSLCVIMVQQLCTYESFFFFW